MTTFYAPKPALPRTTAIAAALQLAELVLVSAYTTVCAGLILYFTDDGGTHADGVAALMLALLVAAPAPTAAVALLISFVRARRSGAPPLVRFELATCAAVLALIAATLVSVTFGGLTGWAWSLMTVGPVLVTYLALAAAVVVPLRRAQQQTRT